MTTTAQERVDAWNAEHAPIGTPVVFWPGERAGTGYRATTRYAAWVTPSGSPVVSVHGYSGGIHLDHVEAANPTRWRETPPIPPPVAYKDSEITCVDGVREVRWDLGFGCYVAFEDDADADPDSDHLELFVAPRGLTARIVTGPDFPACGNDTRRIGVDKLREHIEHLQRLLFAIQDREETS